MQEVQRFLLNITTNELEETVHFYTILFDFEINYKSDWFIHLVSSKQSFELGIIDKNHEVVPQEVKQSTSGLYLTFVVEDLEIILTKAQTEGFTVLEAPKDMFYGQKRLLLQDCNNLVIDVSSVHSN